MPEHGRVRICGGLLVSVNRSWRVDGPTPEPPVAAFRAMAPLAFWAHGDPAGHDTYLAAIGPEEAYWLGFEAESGLYGVSVEIDGTEVTDRLIVPDQPFLDAVRGGDGRYRQLVPEFSGREEPGADIRLSAFRIGEGDLAEGPGSPDEVQPLHTGGPAGATGAPRWPGRAVREGFAPPAPCGALRFLLVRPERFSELTGTELNPQDFTAQGEPPAPFDPFR